MRVVADTNTVVSGLLWQGPPRQVLDAARGGLIHLFASAALLAELEDVLSREKLALRLERASVALPSLVWGYAALATVVKVEPIAPVIADDPEDDAVLACALGAHADAIVSGDRHLLRLQIYQGIPVLTAPELLARLMSHKA